MTDNIGDLAALIKLAQAKYSALSPEQKADHDRAQRESWVRGMTAWPEPKFKYVDGVKVYESYEDYLND